MRYKPEDGSELRHASGRRLASSKLVRLLEICHQEVSCLSTMLDYLLSPLFDWLHLPQKHVDPWPNDASPTDDCPLPFATSVTDNASQIFTWQTIFVRHPFLFSGIPFIRS